MLRNGRLINVLQFRLLTGLAYVHKLQITLSYRNVITRINLFSLFVFVFLPGSINYKQRDVTNYCKDLLRILEQASSLSERVTANKLVDAWCGKGQSSLRVRDLKAPDLSREDCERVVVNALLEGVLREDFHFTPYATISYLLAGPKAGLIQAGKRLFMDFREGSASKAVSQA